MKKITRKHQIQFLQKYATKDLVLDIGGGRSIANHVQNKYFPKRHAFDIDSARQPDTVGDVHNMPFPDNSFKL